MDRELMPPPPSPRATKLAFERPLADYPWQELGTLTAAWLKENDHATLWAIELQFQRTLGGFVKSDAVWRHAMAAYFESKGPER